MKLHGLEISGNTYKVKLLLHLLDIKYHFIEIDIEHKQHKSDEFLQLNPRGEFPVLEDESIVIWDSQAILIYIARKYGLKHNENHWYPDNATELAYITQWLTVANDEIFHTLGKARSILKFGYDGDLVLYQKQGKKVLKWLNRHLNNNQWLATDKPSIADIACYPYVALCEEGDISLNNYPAIHNWFERIQQLKGYTNMPGL
ncbi:MAG: glutathione S-transferase [endosymbiont of Galathealinum brachiosum]|uniref:Glutathione S-transferase n=1 Tax=endosymbiont of Galathealinum brachiosum TaxID=2200906 RepID=A0A370DFR9_9GAMM|nr:MAG: glutathione S-transferase [endosymbiont of Galathealinum brachiosum]